MDYPGEKLLIKMWESLVDKGVGSLLKPWQMRREGKILRECQRKDKLMIAKTEEDIEKLKNGELTIDSNYNLLPVTSGATILNDDNCIDLTRLISQSVIDEIPKVISKRVNVSKAILHAEEVLMDDHDEPSEDPIDLDWLNQWAEYVGNISSEQLQLLWGKILAGEVKSPGKYSRRTLSFIKDLSQKEAELIAKIAPFVTQNYIVKDVGSTKTNISIDNLLSLEAMGILNASSSGIGSVRMVFSSDRPDKYEKALVYGNTLLIIRASDAAKKLELPVYSITSLGTEIISIGNFTINEEHLLDIGKYIVNKGFTVQMTKQFNFEPNGIIRFFNETSITI